ncbi:hypothetical protein Tco_1270939 [Tanacetum coccineum]
MLSTITVGLGMCCFERRTEPSRKRVNCGGSVTRILGYCHDKCCIGGGQLFSATWMKAGVEETVLTFETMALLVIDEFGLASMFLGIIEDVYPKSYHRSGVQ